RELVDELLLDHPLEGSSAVRRVVAEVSEQRAGIVRELDVDPPLEEAAGEKRDLQLDDLAELLARERLELHDLVEPVDELGLELLPDRVDPARDIRGHDEDGVGEVDGPALAVGEAAVVH